MPRYGLNNLCCVWTKVYIITKKRHLAFFCFGLGTPQVACSMNADNPKFLFWDIGMNLMLGSHYVCHGRYHVRLPTAWRRKIFNDGKFSFFKKCAEIICKCYPWIKVLEIKHNRDCIYILISSAPLLSGANGISTIKTNTSSQINNIF